MSEQETENLDQNEEIVEEPKEELTPEEEKTGIINTIREKIAAFRSPQEESGDDIPEEFTEYARSQNWSDEDTQEFASNYTDEELKEMIPILIAEEPSEEENPAEPEKEEETVEDSQEDEKIQKLLDRIDALEKAQGDANKETEQQKVENQVQKASQLFDEAAKEFAIFGKTEELPTFPDGRLVPNSPQLKARIEVWDTAQSLQKTGMDFDKSMSIAMNAYKGANLTADVKRNFIRDLKKNESRLSGKHTSHESFASEDVTGPDVIREVLRRAGREER
jgi:hypothetical protein